MDAVELKQYKKDYKRGWNASRRGTDGALDRADGRGEVTAWFAGYYDYAAGRDQFVDSNGVHRLTGVQVFDPETSWRVGA